MSLAGPWLTDPRRNATNVYEVDADGYRAHRARRPNPILPQVSQTIGIQFVG
jgi:hypothetical protein